jgi:hypothetical protein
MGRVRKGTHYGSGAPAPVRRWRALRKIEVLWRGRNQVERSEIACPGGSL